jgi:hypothetical protein
MPEVQIKALFRQHRSTFERILQMVNEDALVGRIHADYVDSKALSSQRIEAYRHAMREAGIKRIWAQGTSQPLYLLVDSTGALDIGIYKSISYLPGLMEESEASLDQSCFPEGSTAPTCSAARHLEGMWWIVLEEYQ